jgi:hypothetical protein
MIVEITDMILCYDGHSKCTQFAVNHLGKQSMILGYNWLHNHNPEIKSKDVRMSHCPTLYLPRRNQMQGPCSQGNNIAYQRMPSWSIPPHDQRTR